MEQLRRRVREMGAASLFGLAITVVLIVVIVVILLQFLAPGSDSWTAGIGDDASDTAGEQAGDPGRRSAPPPARVRADSHARGDGAGASRSDVIDAGAPPVAREAFARPFVRTELGDRQVAKAKRDMERLAAGIEEFVSLAGRLPNALDDLANPRPGRLDGLLDGLPVPTDPWGRDYLFETEDGQVVLRTLGSDGKRGGTGYAADIEVIL